MGQPAPSGAMEKPERTHLKLIRSGGLLMVLAGVLVLATIPIIPILIPSLAPSSAAAGLSSLQSQAFLYSLTWGLYLVSDILYAVVFVALYFALKSVNRMAMLVALILNTLFVAVDVAIDIP